MKTAKKINIKHLVGIAALAAALQIEFAYAEFKDNKGMDQLALSAKKKSVATLAQIAKERAGTGEEPILLLRASEGMQDCAAIEFRIANSIAAQKKAAANFKQYHQYYTQSLSYLDRIIANYSTSKAAPRAYYLRGKARNELSRKKDAIADFKYLVDHFFTDGNATLGNLLLSDLLIEQKDYPLAVHYLTKLSSRGGETYTLALDRMALVYYLLDDLPNALKQIKELMAYYNKNESSSTPSNKEKALLNGALYYATAIEKKLPGYEVLGAIRYFKTIEKGPEVIKAIIQFANIMRTHGHERELEQMKAYAVKGELNNMETAMLLNVVFEYQLNLRQYAKMKQTIEELDKVILKVKQEDSTGENVAKIKRGLASAISVIQKDFTSNKDKPEGKQIAEALILLYNYSIKSANEEPSIKARSAYNLAETYTLLKDYKTATQYYRWVTTNTPLENADDKKLVFDAELKSILSRYDQLKNENVFPKNLTPIAAAKAAPRALPADAQEWVQWLDAAHYKFKATPSMDMIQFEANRLTYSYGLIDEALEKLKTYCAQYPHTEYAVASASLIIDTHVAGSDWKSTYDTAFFFLKQKKWKDAEFPKRLTQAAADAYFKTIENLYKNKEYANTQKYTEIFVTRYPQSKNITPCLQLAANSALALGDNQKAIHWFDKMEKLGKITPDQKSTFVLTKGTVLEDKFDFEGAAQSYKDFLSSSSKAAFTEQDLDDLKRKTIFFTAFKSNSKELESTRSFCGKKLESDCEKYFLLSELYSTDRADEKNLKKEFFALNRLSNSNNLYRTALLVKNRTHFTFEEQKSILTSLSKVWSDNSSKDSIANYTALTALNENLPEMLASLRKQVKGLARIKIDPKAIAKRVKMIEETENSFNLLLNSPWTNFQVSALNELANLYADITLEIEGLPKPTGFSADDMKSYENTLAEIKAPFISKTQSYREKAVELAQSSFPSFSTLPDLFSRYNTETKRTGHARGTQEDVLASDQKRSQRIVDYVVSRSMLANMSTALDPDGKKYLTSWIQQVTKSMESRNYSKLAFLIQEASARNTLPPEHVNYVTAYSLLFAGARTEGLRTLADSVSVMTEQAKAAHALLTSVAYFDTYNEEKARDSLREFFTNDYSNQLYGKNMDIAQFLLAASKWSGLELPAKAQATLSQVKTVPQLNARTPSSAKKGAKK